MTPDKLVERAKTYVVVGNDGTQINLGCEIERLRKMLTDHGINPDGEYIGPSGLRVDPPASKIQPDF